MNSCAQERSRRQASRFWRARRFVHCALVLALALPWAGKRVLASGTGQSAAAAFRDGVVLLAFRSGVSASREGAILASIGAREVKRIGVGVHVLSVGHGRVRAAIQFLKTQNEVRYAEPDYVETVDAGSLPSDTYAGNQWAVQNTGQMVNGVIGTAGADERSLAAWSVTTGTNGSNAVVVAVLDTGVQYSHPDLLTNMWNNPGGIGGCPVGTHGYNVLTAACDPMDDDTGYGGHGTHVAGILGAAGNNAAGTAGVNWTTSIMAVKWVYGNNVGNTSDLITAMDWVVKAKQAGVNVRVVNDSATWPSTGFSQALSDEIDLLGANDILLVTAAGNTAQNNDVVPRYPCVYNRPTQLCVAASDQNDNLWSSSNYGPNSVALAAPGVNIYSTLRQSNYGYISGCSMAAPQVSGTAALILSLGYQSVSNLKSMILSNVDPLPSLTSYVTTGGRLNVCKAVPGCATATTAVPTNSGQPVVTGIPQQGSVLGASTGSWTGLPTTYSYQWNRCDVNGLNCSPIPGATSANYASLGSADAGATLSVSVTALNAAGSSSAQSGASGVVAQAASPFAISSTILDGSTISGTLQWMASPALTVNFVQFYIDGVLSQTSSASPYIYNQSTTGLLDTTTLSNGTHVLGIRALLNDNRTYGFYGATVTVANTPTNTAPPMVSGTAISGQTLTTTTGSWANNPTAYAYQWNHCDVNGANCSAVQGANASSYVLANSDAGFTIRSSVSATNSAGSASAVSAQTAVVQSNAPFITTTSLPTGAQNAAYSATLAATSGTTPYTWSLASGSLPSGLALAAGTGVISGTPTGSGTSNFTVQVTDANSLTATKALSLTVNAPPTITTTSLPSGAQNSAYSATLAATGGTTPYTWSVASGSLPAGLMLAGGTGAISGTPTGSGTSNFTVQVTDANSMTATKSFSLTINSTGSSGGGIGLLQANAVEGMAVRSLSVAFPSANTQGNLIIAFVRMSTTGQTVTLTDSAGNPYALAVTQAQSTDGHQVYVFYAKNIVGGANKVTATFSSTNNHPWLAIYEYNGLSATNPLDQTAHAMGAGAGANSGATATTTSANELIFAATGLPAGYKGTVTPGSGYVLLQQDTGTSRGANEAVVMSSTGSYSGTFSLGPGTNWSAVVATFAPAGTAPNPPSVTTSSLPSGSQNAAYTATLTATGGTTPYTWSIISGTLPAGLSLTANSGVISGTPTGAGTSSFTVQVTDANSLTGTQALTITVNAAPTITTSSLPAGTQNAAYSATLTASGGTAPYTWSLTSGSLPAGLTLASSTGVISGTPTSAGTSSFTVQVADANSLTATRALTITVNAAPTITTSSLPAGTQNTAYSATLTATGGAAPYTWSLASGSLPAGLMLASSTGVISGTPTSAGTSSFTLQVTDANSLTATKVLTLTINAASGGGGSGIALVQSSALRGTAMGSLSVTFPIANTPGNLIIAFVRMSTTGQTVTLSDSAGNPYALAVTQAQSTDGHQVYVFYAKNIVGGANTITATFSSTNNHPWLAIYEYSGLSATNPLDQTAHAMGAGAAANSGATATTASANELVFAATGLPAGYKGTVTPGSGYVLLQQDTGTSRGANEAVIMSSTGSYAGTFSLGPGTNWSAVVATFKQ
jgi:hypothetical protein